MVSTILSSPINDIPFDYSSTWGIFLLLTVISLTLGTTDIYFCFIGNSVRVEIKAHNEAQDAQNAQQAQMQIIPMQMQPMQMQQMPMQQVPMQQMPMQQQHQINNGAFNPQQQPQPVMMPVTMQPQYQTFQNNQIQPYNQPMQPGYPQQPPIES